MKARRKGTDNPFEDVYMVQLKGTDILYKADVMEFEHDTLSTEIIPYYKIEEEKHWTDVREKAAIAALTGMLADTNTAGSYNDYAEAAIACADALVEQLKNN